MAENFRVSSGPSAAGTRREGVVLSMANVPGAHGKEPVYTEMLRSSELSVGVYSIPAGTFDPQSPHSEDELYYVREGYGLLRVGETDHPVSPGAVIYVPATVPHRFHSIRQSIVAMVVFAPPEGTRPPQT